MLVTRLLDEYRNLVLTVFMFPDFWPKRSGAGLTNDFRETLTYGELSKHKFYLILWNIEWVSYSNNFIKCLCNRARCILIHNFLELGNIYVSKVHREIRSPVNRSRIRSLMYTYVMFDWNNCLFILSTGCLIWRLIREGRKSW